jgi:hypothetical protein
MVELCATTVLYCRNLPIVQRRKHSETQEVRFASVGTIIQAMVKISEFVIRT